MMCRHGYMQTPTNTQDKNHVPMYTCMVPTAPILGFLNIFTTQAAMLEHY